MPRILRPGQRVGAYQVIEQLGNGAFAVAYKAQTSHSDAVFLKQYKMPAVTTPWYRDYVAHQRELKRRVESHRAKDYVYRFVDFFEAEVGSRCYFQVFEFIDKGENLRHILDRHRATPGSVSWEQRVLFAKVLMAAIAQLHLAKIVHTDLKPENIQLIEMPSIAARYMLKLIDMDFSILSDREPPWHTDVDFHCVGTPGYFSPEHLNSTTPGPASDVFTCGLMLAELLAGGHPFLASSIKEYASKIARHSVAPVPLEGTMPAPADQSLVATIIGQCLAENAYDRPSAAKVSAVLNGRTGAATTKPRHRPPARVSGAPSVPALVLRADNRKEICVGVRTVLGRSHYDSLGLEAQYCADQQCVLVPGDAGWQVEPVSTAPNETLLNGRPVTAGTPLKNGDVLAVGRAAKGVQKIPLTVLLK